MGMRMYRAGLGQNLTALDIGTLYTAEQYADVVARDGLIQQLAEHFYAGYYGGTLLVAQTNDFYGILYLYGAALYTTGGNGAAAGDAEYVFNRHKERLVGSALGFGNVLVNSIHQLEYAFAFLASLRHAAVLEVFQSLQRAALDDGDLVAGEVVAGEHFTDFHFNKLEQFGIVDLVCLVHEYYDVRYADLTGKQYVLTGLGHRTVSRADDQDSAVHLGSTGYHVLYIVRVTRAVYVGVVTLFGLVLDVRGVDRYSAGLLFRGLVDFVIPHRRRMAFLAQRHRYGCGQGGLAVVNVAYRADVYVRLSALEFCLCH